jgi:hypothetical protein
MLGPMQGSGHLPSDTPRKLMRINAAGTNKRFLVKMVFFSLSDPLRVTYTNGKEAGKLAFRRTFLLQVL